MLNLFTFFKKKSKIFTFTYYIPAPPSRNTPYQEKQFDNLMKCLAEEGHKIVDIKMQNTKSDHNNGTLVIVLYEANHINGEFNASKLDDGLPILDSHKPEGLYYLD